MTFKHKLQKAEKRRPKNKIKIKKASVFSGDLPDSAESTVAVQHTAAAAVAAGRQWSYKSRQ